MAHRHAVEVGGMAAQEQSWGVVEPEEQGRKLQKQTNTKQVSNYGFNSCTGLTFCLRSKTWILPAGTTIGGGLGAMM